MRILVFFFSFLVFMGAAQTGHAGCDISTQDGITKCFSGARSGNYKDQLTMSYIYWNGVLVNPDLNKALNWALISCGGIPEESHDDIEYKTRSWRFMADIYKQMRDLGKAKTAYTVCAGMPRYNDLPVNFEADVCRKTLDSLPTDLEMKKVKFTVEDLRQLRKEMYNDQEMLRLAGRGTSNASGTTRQPTIQSGGSAKCGMTEDQYNEINNSYTTRENCAKAFGWFKCMGYKGAIALWFENKKGYCTIDSLYASCQDAQNLMRNPGGTICWDN